MIYFVGVFTLLLIRGTLLARMTYAKSFYKVDNIELNY